MPNPLDEKIDAATTRILSAVTALMRSIRSESDISSQAHTLALVKTIKTELRSAYDQQDSR